MAKAQVFYYKPGDVAKHQTIGQYLNHLEKGDNNEFEYRIEINKILPIRSLGQNRYYFGIVLKIISVASGEDDTQKLHDDYAYRFNPDQIHYPNGEVRTVPGSTSKMDKAQFATYVNRVKADARMHFPGIVFPERGDVDRQLWEEVDRNHRQSFEGI